MSQLEFNFTFNEWNWITPMDRADISDHLWGHFTEQIWARRGRLDFDPYYRFYYRKKSDTYAYVDEKVPYEFPISDMLTARFDWRMDRNDHYGDTQIRVRAELLPHEYKGNPYLVFTRRRDVGFRSGRVEYLSPAIGERRDNWEKGWMNV